ncbi:hypothetical protein SAMN05216231_1966 [Virgibacillus salinus]|uniref:Uncharacterized protein n=1 Tax=Virgibacillus salinus TaxID=553311 RepID=A0A1H1BXP8_9BACI|nr:hypothetical protein SAMN05216231_1966 [Virgibacillus salinus]
MINTKLTEKSEDKLIIGKSRGEEAYEFLNSILNLK